MPRHLQLPLKMGESEKENMRSLPDEALAKSGLASKPSEVELSRIDLCKPGQMVLRQAQF
jgi:hypothetical protein